MSLQYLNECIQNHKVPSYGTLANHRIVYTKALLEAHFSPRKFTYDEIKGLLLDVFPDKSEDLK